jgi:hypothetical protein
MTEDKIISRRILDWFEGEDANHGWQESIRITDEINSMIEAMSRPLTASAAAWKDWQDFESECTEYTANFYTLMEMCQYAEWCVKTDLGLTSEPFAGVPRIVVTRE